MGGFGVALGFPFALFAMFPNMLKALPKSGGWLNTTKVSFRLFRVGTCLSNFYLMPILFSTGGLLKIEVFLAIWILIFLGLALYIFGVLKFPHDSPIKKLFLRFSSGRLVFAFVVYLGSGFKLNEPQKHLPH